MYVTPAPMFPDFFIFSVYFFCSFSSYFAVWQFLLLWFFLLNSNIQNKFIWNKMHTVYRKLKGVMINFPTIYISQFPCQHKTLANHLKKKTFRKHRLTSFQIWRKLVSSWTTDLISSITFSPLIAKISLNFKVKICQLIV